MGTREEYRTWEDKARAYLRGAGRDPSSLVRVDATINYRDNRIILFNLPDPANELSVEETLSHEWMHALLEQMGERWAARTLDSGSRPVGDPRRIGGI